MNNQVVSKKWLYHFYAKDNPSMKDFLLANLNLVLEDGEVDKIELGYDSIFGLLEEALIQAKLGDIPLASTVSEGDFTDALEHAAQLLRNRKAETEKALEAGGWIRPEQQNCRRGRKPGPKSCIIMWKYLLGAPHEMVKSHEKGKAKEAYLVDAKYKFEVPKLQRKAERYALTLVKRAHDRAFRDIPEPLYRWLLFSTPQEIDCESLRSEAAEVKRAIEAAMRRDGYTTDL